MAFVNGFGSFNRGNVRNVGSRHCKTRLCMSAAGDVELMKLKLTPELERLTKSFRSFPEGKLRYQQLLHLATTLAPMEASLKVPENKVRTQKGN